MVYITINMYDYYIWKKFYSEKDIIKLNNICNLNKENSFKDVEAYSNLNKKKLKNFNNVECVQWKYVKNILQKALNEIEINNQFNYGYSIYNLNDLDTVLFNTYKENDFYDWHKDLSNNPNHDIKFTILINNSLKEYEGGDFKIFSYGGENTIKDFNESGTVLMFKGDIPHKVISIKKGIRNSIVFFIKGNKFI